MHCFSHNIFPSGALIHEVNVDRHHRVVSLGRRIRFTVANLKRLIIRLRQVTFRVPHVSHCGTNTSKHLGL